MSWSFNILGPLEVLLDGDPVVIRGPRQQALLALLVLNRNMLITSERILDELWPDELPASGRAALQMNISRLRRSLAGREEEREPLITVAGGYLLRTAAGEVDADAFDRLVVVGRRALASGDSARAEEVLGSALTLWRGEALAGLAGAPFAAGEIARLHELRVAAQESRVEALLALGRHVEVIGELEDLIFSYPHRERPRQQLMLALYRDGRQAEALALYRSARRMFVSELGIEPGPELRQLEAAVLRHDSALAAPAPHDAGPIHGPDERKLATALVAELVVAGDDPERIRPRMERFAAAAEQAVARAGGWIEHSTSAIVVAAFGVPIACQDHAQRALRVALELAEAERVRIGIDTGEVLVSGSDRMPLLIVGDAVQLALALAHTAVSGEVLVGQRCRAIAEQDFEWDGRRLLRADVRTHPPLQGRSRAFVGRAPELEWLAQALALTRAQRRPQLVTVVGEAGVGKSSLVRRFAQASDAIARTGRCLAYGQGITYWPLGEVIRAELGVDEDAPVAGVVERLGDHAAAAATLGADVLSGMHPAAARERVHGAWIGWVSDVAAHQPLVVVVEDLHWAADDLLDLLERTVREATGPLLLVATARPELPARRPDFGSRAGSSASLRLQRLQPDETLQLVRQLLGGSAARDVIEMVVARAEGNPFFVEETVAALLERGALEHSAEGWPVNTLTAEIAVADTIYAALAGRIDLLPPTAKQTLRAASVIGPGFSAGAVDALVGDSAASLDVLVQREFVHPASGSLGSDRRFTFKHALTREVAYHGLTKAQRSHLHLQYATWLEATRGGPDEDSPFLAHHYAEAASLADADLVWSGREAEHAQVRVTAARWLAHAADVAYRRGAVRESASVLERAVELEPHRLRRARLLRALAHSYAVLYNGEAFQAALERCADVAGDLETRAEVTAELAYQSWLRPSLWQQQPDSALIDRWITEAIELNPQPTEARVKALTAMTWSDATVGHDTATEAIRIAETLDRDDLRFMAYTGQLEVSLIANQTIDAMQWARRLRALAKSADDPDDRAWIEWYAAFAHAACGRIEEARAYARDHDKIVSGLTPHLAIHGLGLQTMIDELAGRWDCIRAIGDRLERAVAANASTRCHLDARALLDCALAAHLAGDLAEAIRFEALADQAMMPGVSGLTVEVPRLRLAIARRDTTTIERLLNVPTNMTYTMLANTSARLDGLATLDRHAEVEALAPTLLQPGTYLEPFALRALGVVRRDADLLARGHAAFMALGLAWHAAETSRG